MTPDMSDRNSSGSSVEATISPTQVADELVSSFISQDPATVCTNEPTLEKIAAIHNAR